MTPETFVLNLRAAYGGKARIPKLLVERYLEKFRRWQVAPEEWRVALRQLLRDCPDFPTVPEIQKAIFLLKQERGLWPAPAPKSRRRRRQPGDSLWPADPQPVGDQIPRGLDPPHNWRRRSGYGFD